MELPKESVEFEPVSFKKVFEVTASSFEVVNGSFSALKHIASPKKHKKPFFLFASTPQYEDTIDEEICSDGAGMTLRTKMAKLSLLILKTI